MRREGGARADPASDSICLVGAYPPPIHGAALINEAMRRSLERRGVQPSVINLASPVTDKAPPRRRLRLAPVFRGLGRLARLLAARRVRTTYFGLSGGYGQLYEWAFVVLARLGRCRIVMHHHSYAYLQHPTWLARLLFTSAGRRTTHMVLCEDMAERLRAAYPGINTVFVVSNVGLLPLGTAPVTPRSRLRVVGFLGNITYDKGILEALATLGEATARHPDLIGRIAGPCTDPAIAARIETVVRHNPRIEYVGAVYGQDKDRFFADIDALLFPSRYVHEAEPLTVYEALGQGVPVIARRRGCLGSTLDRGEGIAVPEGPQGNEYVAVALARIDYWFRDAAAYSRASAAALERVARDRPAATARLEALLDLLTDRRERA